MTPTELIAFEDEVAASFERGEVRGPIHLSGGNEEHLIRIFNEVEPADWVFSTWRSHYHALLHGVPRETLMADIKAGRSMNLMYPERRFYSSAIVAGCLPIALGAAAAIKRAGAKERVWCFVGDMSAMTGAFEEAERYAFWHQLPISFVIEDNRLSTNTPTSTVWGTDPSLRSPTTRLYGYTRSRPHCGTGKWVTF